jgi:hypothetical protein
VSRDVAIQVRQEFTSYVECLSAIKLVASVLLQAFLVERFGSLDLHTIGHYLQNDSGTILLCSTSVDQAFRFASRGSNKTRKRTKFKQFADVYFPVADQVDGGESPCGSRAQAA